MNSILSVCFYYIIYTKRTTDSVKLVICCIIDKNTCSFNHK